VIFVLHVGLASCVTDKLRSFLEQGTSALLPLSKNCLQSSAGPFWWEATSPPQLCRCFLRSQSCLDNLALIAYSSDKTQVYKPHKYSYTHYWDSWLKQSSMIAITAGKSFVLVVYLQKATCNQRVE